MRWFLPFIRICNAGEYKYFISLESLGGGQHDSMKNWIFKIPDFCLKPLSPVTYGSQKSLYPWLKCHENEEKFDNDYCFKEMTIESKLLNQFHWSWYHSFQKTMFFLMKSKHVIFSNIKVKKIERSTFFWTPGIGLQKTCCNLTL